MKRLMNLFVFAFFLFGMVFSFPGILADENGTDNSSVGSSEANDSVSDNGTEITNGSDDEIETENDADVDGGEEIETEGTEEVDDETEVEIEEMDVPIGAELRILQLQRQLLIHILRANLVIDSLKELGKDTAELESIVAELEVLKEDAKIIPDNRGEAIQKFIDTKKEARDLIKQFRELVREMTTESERESIRTKFSEIRENAEFIAFN